MRIKADLKKLITKMNEDATALDPTSDERARLNADIAFATSIKTKGVLSDDELKRLDALFVSHKPNSAEL